VLVAYSTIPKLTEGESWKGTLKPEHYRTLPAKLPDELMVLFVGFRRLAFGCEVSAPTESRSPLRADLRRHEDVRGYAASDERVLFARGSKPIQNLRLS
jgi:hypothetical protein